VPVDDGALGQLRSVHVVVLARRQYRANRGPAAFDLAQEPSRAGGIRLCLSPDHPHGHAKNIGPRTLGR